MYSHFDDMVCEFLEEALFSNKGQLKECWTRAQHQFFKRKTDRTAFSPGDPALAGVSGDIPASSLSASTLRLRPWLWPGIACSGIIMKLAGGLKNRVFFKRQVVFVSLLGQELSVPELLRVGTMSRAIEGVRFLRVMVWLAKYGLRPVLGLHSLL